MSMLSSFHSVRVGVIEYTVPAAAAGSGHAPVCALCPRGADLLREDDRQHAHGEAPLRHVQELNGEAG